MTKVPKNRMKIYYSLIQFKVTGSAKTYNVQMTKIPLVVYAVYAKKLWDIDIVYIYNTYNVRLSCRPMTWVYTVYQL